MPEYIVRIKATVEKDVHVTASNDDRASERAHELFTLDCEGADERYSQDVVSITAVK